MRVAAGPIIIEKRATPSDASAAMSVLWSNPPSTPVPASAERLILSFNSELFECVLPASPTATEFARYPHLSQIPDRSQQSIAAERLTELLVKPELMPPVKPISLVKRAALYQPASAASGGGGGGRSGAAAVRAMFNPLMMSEPQLSSVIAPVDGACPELLRRKITVPAANTAIRPPSMAGRGGGGAGGGGAGQFAYVRMDEKERIRCQLYALNYETWEWRLFGTFSGSNQRPLLPIAVNPRNVFYRTAHQIAVMDRTTGSVLTESELAAHATDPTKGSDDGADGKLTEIERGLSWFRRPPPECKQSTNQPL